MTTGGMVFLVLAWGVIISLVTFCYYRTLSKHDEDQPDEYEVQ